MKMFFIFYVNFNSSVCIDIATNLIQFFTVCVRCVAIIANVKEATITLNGMVEVAYQKG